MDTERLRLNKKISDLVESSVNYPDTKEKLLKNISSYIDKLEYGYPYSNYNHEVAKLHSLINRSVHDYEHRDRLEYCINKLASYVKYKRQNQNV